jgi:hypothetical protein
VKLYLLPQAAPNVVAVSLHDAQEVAVRVVVQETPTDAHTGPRLSGGLGWNVGTEAVFSSCLHLFPSADRY